jgi:hypothetical protein
MEGLVELVLSLVPDLRFCGGRHDVHGIYSSRCSDGR